MATAVIIMDYHKLSHPPPLHIACCPSQEHSAVSVSATITATTTADLNLAKTSSH